MLTIFPGIPARAQSPERARLHFLGQPSHHSDRSRLNIRLGVRNTGTRSLRGLEANISIHSRLTSRSDLEASFNGNEDSLVLESFTTSGPRRPLRPGESASFVVREKVSELLPGGRTEAGVYPVTISLRDAQAQREFDTLSTPLIYYPSTPETPLNMVVVVPFHAAPQRAPDGLFHFDESSGSLEAGVRSTGWLGGLLHALSHEGRSAPLGVAVTPRVVEEVADIASGYERVEDDERVRVPRNTRSSSSARRFLDGLSSELNRSNREPVMVPYSFADLPAIKASVGDDDLTEQLAAGRDALKEDLGVEFAQRPWLQAPEGRMDAGTLAALQEVFAATTDANGLRVLLGNDSLESVRDPAEAGCPVKFASFACPLKVQTLEGHSRGFVTDEELQDRLSALVRPGDTQLDLHRLLAETAMIREEVPGVSGRVVQMTIPASWHPSPAQSAGLLNRLATAPWLAMRTPSRGLALAAEVGPRRIETTLDPPPLMPDDSYYQAVAETDAFLSDFEHVAPPGSVLDRLQDNLLVSESRSWWGDPVLEAQGREFATASETEASEALGQVRITAAREITLTSRGAELPLVVTNDIAAGYPVTVDIILRSDDLDLSETALNRRIEPGTNQFLVDVRTSTSGTFPLEAYIEVPRSDRRIATAPPIRVRSTQFNRVALVITFGALLFLIFFYVLRGVRSRRQASSDEPAEAAPA
jgi:hypothetical protein